MSMLIALDPRGIDLAYPAEFERHSVLAQTTGFLSEIGTKLRESAVGQAEGSCYSWAALSSNDSKTL